MGENKAIPSRKSKVLFPGTPNPLQWEFWGLFVSQEIRMEMSDIQNYFATHKV
jgi:hypothetical protein